MPDSLKKRGKHPRDEAAFNPEQYPRLLSASGDLAWLKTRGYAGNSSLKLVGDRYKLNARQRTAVARSTCGDDDLKIRLEKVVAPAEIENQTIHIDGFNLLTTIEALLGGGVLLIGRDTCLRDMSSMHGNYRALEDTSRALELINEFFDHHQPRKIRWLLDKPVSNSGRLKTKIESQKPATPLEVKLVQDPDPILKKIDSPDDVIITADSEILNRSGKWLNGAWEIFQFHSMTADIMIDFRIRVT